MVRGAATVHRGLNKPGYVFRVRVWDQALNPDNDPEILLLRAGLQVFTAAVDGGLNKAGYVVPGMGDAGDRAFGTIWTDQNGNS